MATRTENAVIDATLFWAALVTPNDMSGKFQVDLGQLTPEAAATIKGWGIPIKEDAGDGDKKPNKGTFVTAKSNYPIKVVFKAGISEVDPSVIGNETMAKVKINPYDWKFKTKTGTSLGVSKLQVTMLNEYVRKQDDDSDFEGTGDVNDDAPFDLDDFED